MSTDPLPPADQLRELLAALEARERTLLPYGAHLAEWLYIRRLAVRVRRLLEWAIEGERGQSEFDAACETMLRNMKRKMFRVIQGSKK